MGVSVPALIIDQETLDHLPAFYKAIAEVLIEKGRWQLADGENKDFGARPGEGTLKGHSASAGSNECR